MALPAQEPNPALVFDGLSAYQKTAALRAAIDLDVFTAAGEGTRTAEQLAQRCSASPRGIRILCDYLTVHGFLAKDAGGYSLTPSSAVFLDRRSPACMASVTHFLNTPKLMAGFANLTETVRRGSTLLPDEGVIEAQLEEWVVFAKSMMPLMRSPSQFIAEEAVAGGEPPRRVLDIAAGHGLFGIAIAGRSPEAEIVSLDWPNVLAVAEENAAKAGIGKRYRLLPGSAFTTPFGEGYDTVLLTNFLHHFDEATCVGLLQKIHACMAPGGRLFTLEFVPNEDRVSPPVPATFSMTMLGITPAGDAYTFSQLDAMLKRAGFAESVIKQVPHSPEQVVITRK